MRWMVLLVVLLVACSSAETSSPPDHVGATAGAGGAGGASVCSQGDTRACTGPGACVGGQVCDSDERWGACDCGDGGAQQSGGAGGAQPMAGGAGGAQTSAGSGGSCTPLPAEKACAVNQCGVAQDGCGGEVACAECPMWKVCTAQSGGVSTCEGPCNVALVSHSQCAIYAANGKPWTKTILCPLEQTKPADCIHAVGQQDGQNAYCCE